MKNIFKNLKNIDDKIKDTKSFFIFLDFDGTLTPIMPRPIDAVLSEDTRGLIQKLATVDKYIVAIVSGRGLRDLKNMVGVKNIFYAGNHGCEIYGRGMNFVHPECLAFEQALKKIVKELNVKLAHIKGVFIENKKYTASVHYRGVFEKEQPKVVDAFYDIVDKYMKDNIKVTTGKKVLEIRPKLDWHKGHAIKKIISYTGKRKYISCFVGDDTTDEDAFNVLRDDDIGIRVGNVSTSSAKYYCSSVDDVKKILEGFLVVNNE